MTQRREQEPSAVGLFFALDLAVDRGDYRRASQAQEALAILGWDVRRRPQQVAREADQAAGGPIRRKKQVAHGG